MPMLRLSRRQKAGLAVALALLLWVPQGISTHEQTLVTGHSTFYNGTAYDTCMASIAGIIRSQVMWFNDQVLVDRYAGTGTFLYVTEKGAPDPRDPENVLYSEGVFYDFVDPNGAHWHVEEAFMKRVEDGSSYGPGLTNVKPDAKVNRTYVWVVELAAKPIHDQFAGNDPQYYHDLYNFLILVDTCKMHSYAYHGNETHDSTAELSTERGHPSDATAHDHETFLADLWVGKRPLILAPGESAMPVWESSWSIAAGDDPDDYGGPDDGP